MKTRRQSKICLKPCTWPTRDSLPVSSDCFSHVAQDSRLNPTTGFNCLCTNTTQGLLLARFCRHLLGLRWDRPFSQCWLHCDLTCSLCSENTAQNIPGALCLSPVASTHLSNQLNTACARHLATPRCLNMPKLPQQHQRQETCNLPS